MGPESGSYGRAARFNPGVVFERGRVHMVYRATEGDIGDKEAYVSSLGYARLTPEGDILEDRDSPWILKANEEEKMGIEDARIVSFEGKFYLFYTAYSGDITNVGIIETEDFTGFRRLGYIKNGFWDKDAFIFPRRISGKIAYIHRVEPGIQIDYFNTIEEMLDPASWKGYGNRIGESTIMNPLYDWEKKKIGGSVPPIETEEGWLFIYHGVYETVPGDVSTMVYSAGAALLDLEYPSVVKGRLELPILKPEEEFEIVGDVPNVVFPQGGYVHEGKLYLYYGAADKYVALATYEVKDLLGALLSP